VAYISILLDLLRTNATLNLPTAKNLHVGELSWGEEIAAVPKQVDVVLAADCVYFEVRQHPFVLITDTEPAFPLLVHTLCELAPVGKDMEILFCWKKRRKVRDSTELVADSSRPTSASLRC